ncbi:ATP-dependent DNA helicase DinG [Sediminibacillus massiliensis]|uniref:ATP-dependent DNA helicase DinG n=1 Tax=Sediminibacillus massiliensis TaxID=1926277 RepID=UPI00098858CF|nr:ATP-dependent DNA helicase DinG [Sediminibacillus massiliensis]
MRKYVVVDLETTGHTPSKGDKIIEIGIVVIENEQVVEEFSSFVNPNTPIPSFITNLTGITDANVADAPHFEDIANEVIGLFADAYIVAHNVPFDLGFLNYEIQAAGLTPLKQPVIDTVELSRIMLPQAPGFKLGQLSDYLDLQHTDPHRALSDATVTSKLLIHLLEKIRNLPYETLYQLQELEGTLKSDLYFVLDYYMEELSFTSPVRDDLEVFRGIALKKKEKVPMEDSFKLPSFGDFVEEIYRPDGKIASQMENYEPRSGQAEMSEAIYDAFQSSQHALLEAETGTGKSLAYLIPALYESVKTGQRILISTHLTQLQSQLLEKEIPVLRKVLDFPFHVALIKGKQHYLSLSKYEKELFSDQPDNYDITLTKAIILVWLTETVTGDIDEIQLPSSGKSFFRKVSTDSEEYIDPKSPWFSRSFYQYVRYHTQKANLVITNHSLLCADINSEHTLLPSYNKVIIDEAHHLEGTAAKHFGLKLDYVSIQYLLNSIGSSSPQDWYGGMIARFGPLQEQSDTIWDQLWQQCKEETDDLFRFIFDYVIEKSRKNIAVNDIGRYQYRLDSASEPSAKWNTVKEMTTRLTFFLRDLIHLLEMQKTQLKKNEMATSDDLDGIQNNIDKLQALMDDLESMFLFDEESMVKWVEIEAFGAKNAVYLYCEPVDVAKILADNLFDGKESVILTSATLTMKNSFKYIRERLGLKEEEVIEKRIISPYRYDQQVQLMVPSDFPDMKKSGQEEFIMATSEAILSLAEITEGRMLVLFTSYDMLKKTYNILREFSEINDYMLIAQGISSGSRARLKKNFQAFDKAILLGTSSFWEGVDIPGSDLSSLIIVRLPFQPPDHPVFEAKSQRLQKTGKNPFMEMALPHAVIRFKQGFGRLIRSSTDRGIVFICDDRIVKARYGRYFTDSLPKVPITYDTTSKLMKKADDWI